MLLYRLHKVALAVYPGRNALLVLAGAALGLALHSAVAERDLFAWQLRLSLILALWALMLFAFIHLFRTIPEPVLPGLSWLERLLARVKLWLYRLIVLFVLVLTAILVQTTLKLVTL